MLDEQRTEEWEMARCGKITASRFDDVLSTLKNGKTSQARCRYMKEIVFEILSGVPKKSFSSQATSWGSEIEIFAREQYELATGNLVNESGFVVHPEFPYIGASPDGLIDDDGGMEIKCPYDETVHIQTILDGIPKEHMAQVQGNMFVTGRKWWDFVSFDPRQEESCRIYIQKIERDDEFIKNLEKKLNEFWDDCHLMIDRIRERLSPETEDKKKAKVA